MSLTFGLQVKLEQNLLFLFVHPLLDESETRVGGIGARRAGQNGGGRR